MNVSLCVTCTADIFNYNQSYYKKLKCAATSLRMDGIMDEITMLQREWGVACSNLGYLIFAGPYVAAIMERWVAVDHLYQRIQSQSPELAAVIQDDYERIQRLTDQAVNFWLPG